MKKLSSTQMSRFFLFALPCFWLLAILLLALVLWDVGFAEPDLIPVVLVSIAILISAAFLTKRRNRVCFPIILIGIYIFFTTQNDQHIGYIVPLYGIYLVLHYLAYWIYLRKHETSAHKEDRFASAILCITILFAFSILFIA